MSERLRVLQDSLDRIVLVENFKRAPALNAVIIIDPDADDATALAAYVAANKDFEVLGTNASSDDVTLAVGGGIKCETDGASADQVIILPHLDSNQTSWSTTTWGTDQEAAWACCTTTGSSVADTTIWAGLKLTNTSVVATDANQAFIRYADGTNDDKFQGVYSVAGTDYTIDLGVTVAADATYVLEVHIDSDRKPHFFVNGEEKGVGVALTTAIDLIPYWGVQADTAAAKHAYLRKEVGSRKIAAE
ncbi:MAG: hypothetical protein Q8R92_01800 [Deltaproteobacteria bacterium]|nr:hypothetical protein [Deltaproteobacteria bacterium]